VGDDGAGFERTSDLRPEIDQTRGVGELCIADAVNGFCGPGDGTRGAEIRIERGADHSSAHVDNGDLDGFFGERWR